MWRADSDRMCVFLNVVCEKKKITYNTGHDITSSHLHLQPRNKTYLASHPNDDGSNHSHKNISSFIFFSLPAYKNLLLVVFSAVCCCSVGSLCTSPRSQLAAGGFFFFFSPPSPFFPPPAFLAPPSPFFFFGLPSPGRNTNSGVSERESGGALQCAEREKAWHA